MTTAMMADSGVSLPFPLDSRSKFGKRLIGAVRFERVRRRHYDRHGHHDRPDSGSCDVRFWLVFVGQQQRRRRFEQLFADVSGAIRWWYVLWLVWVELRLWLHVRIGNVSFPLEIFGC